MSEIIFPMVMKSPMEKPKDIATQTMHSVEDLK